MTDPREQLSEWARKYAEPQHIIISNRPARRRWYGRRIPASTVTFGPSSDYQAAAEFAAREMTAGNSVYVATGFGAVWRESRVSR